MKKTYGKVEGTTISEIFKTLSEKNQDYIKEFERWKKGSITDKRLLMITNSLTKFADLLEMDFNEANKTDITIAWNIIYSSSLSVKSKQDDFMHIRQGFKHWFGDDEEYPKVVKGMKRPSQKGHLRLPKKMPSEKDIHHAIKMCRNPRDKFWVAWTGLDSAVRPCENRALTWDRLSKDEHGYFFTIDTAKESGDTETRTIRVIHSEPYLFEWMKCYPGTRKKSDFVFCHLDDPSCGLEEGAVTSLFKKLKKRMGYKGKFSAYVLRHACLTRMSKNPKVAIPILKKLAGHSKGSNVIAEYQHFGDDDVLSMQLEASGRVDAKKNYEIKNKPIRCPHCKTSNPYDSEVCGKCNFALSQERMVDNSEMQKQMDELEKRFSALLAEVAGVKQQELTPMVKFLSLPLKVQREINSSLKGTPQDKLEAAFEDAVQRYT